MSAKFRRFPGIPSTSISILLIPTRLNFAARVCLMCCSSLQWSAPSALPVSVDSFFGTPSFHSSGSQWSWTADISSAAFMIVPSAMPTLADWSVKFGDCSECKLIHPQYGVLTSYTHPSGFLTLNSTINVDIGSVLRGSGRHGQKMHPGMARCSTMCGHPTG